MAGGSIPKRADQRRRRNKPEGHPLTTAPGAAHVDFPLPDDGWHEMARDWYLSLARSGQAKYYEPSDVQVARVWAEVLSRQLLTEKMSAVMIQAWAASAAELLTTEGSRRRGRLELERSQGDADEDASVTMLSAYRERFKP
jgi:hypothetical protein